MDAIRSEPDLRIKKKRSFSMVPGVGAAAAVGAVAYPLGRALPVVGSPAFALALGVLVAAVATPGARLRPGTAFAGRYGLQLAIVLLGTTLSLRQVAHAGRASLPVMLGTLAAALATAALLGRLLGVSPRLRTLVGVGTGICGASAIAAVSGIVGAAEAEVVYAISTIFVFNLAAVLLFPPLGHLLGLGSHAFGTWAGTAVNDTSSVVAAGYAYGHAAGSYAILVKLTRTTMIVPISLALVALRLRSGRAAETRWASIVPWFILWFLAASAADTAGLLGAPARDAFSAASAALVTLALAAVGLQIRLRDLRRTGPRPLLLGTGVWVAVACSSLALQAATGSW